MCYMFICNNVNGYTLSLFENVCFSFYREVYRLQGNTSQVIYFGVKVHVLLIYEEFKFDDHIYTYPDRSYSMHVSRCKPSVYWKKLTI